MSTRVNRRERSATRLRRRLRENPMPWPRDQPRPLAAPLATLLTVSLATLTTQGRRGRHADRAANSAYKGAPMLIDAFLLERDAPTTPPGLQGFLTPMYLVAQRVVRVRLATGRRQFGLMAAMWRSCGNDRRKSGIARSCPLLTRISLSRCRRDQCALRHDQQFVISGPLPS